MRLVPLVLAFVACANDPTLTAPPAGGLVELVSVQRALHPIEGPPHEGRYRGEGWSTNVEGPERRGAYAETVSLTFACDERSGGEVAHVRVTDADGRSLHRSGTRGTAGCGYRVQLAALESPPPAVDAEVLFAREVDDPPLRLDLDTMDGPRELRVGDITLELLEVRRSAGEGEPARVDVVLRHAPEDAYRLVLDLADATHTGSHQSTKEGATTATFEFELDGPGQSVDLEAMPLHLDLWSREVTRTTFRDIPIP